MSTQLNTIDDFQNILLTKVLSSTKLPAHLILCAPTRKPTPKFQFTSGATPNKLFLHSLQPDTPPLLAALSETSRIESFDDLQAFITSAELITGYTTYIQPNTILPINSPLRSKQIWPKAIKFSELPALLYPLIPLYRS